MEELKPVPPAPKKKPSLLVRLLAFLLTLALLLGGAVGNFIDRLLFGFVTDMFATTFMNFPVFNVADIGVVVGGVLLCIHVIFTYSKEPKPEEKP